MSRLVDDQRSKFPQIVFSAVVVVGLVLMVAGFTWRSLVPVQAFWGEAQAAEFEQAKVQLHSLTLTLEPDGGADHPELVSARQRVEKAEQDLAAAQFARNDVGRYVAVFGSLLVGGSALAIYMRRNRSS